jgi:SAM-dependent methyltransferase
MAPKSCQSVAFWERNAPWYVSWLHHNDYHAPIKSLLAERVRPGWRVLDVGGGSGVLSRFLDARGCRTVLLEPAAAMRHLFFGGSDALSGAGEGVEPARWEDLPHSRLAGYDLIVACNSLHTSSLGFLPALEKIFSVSPVHACVVFEDPYAGEWEDTARPGYQLTLAQTRISANHSLAEAEAHAAFRSGGRMDHAGLTQLRASLIREHGHYWLKATARIHLRWWTQIDSA